MQIYQIVLLSLLLLLLALFAIYLIFGYKVLKIMLTPNKERDKEHFPAESPDKTHLQRYEQKWLKETAHEEVSIKSFDKLKLVGYLYMNKVKTNKYILAMHGYNGYWKELSIPCKHYYEDLGYNILFIDERAQNKSEGKYMTMGYKEKFDAISWCDFITSKDPSALICLFGHSMGAATVMMATGMKTLPTNVKCAIEDCGYSSIKEQFLYILSIDRSIPKFLLSAVYLVAKVFYNISFTKDSPIQMLNQSTTPMLFIHGGSDTFVPFRFLDINYNALTNKEVYKDKLVVQPACHGMSFIYDESAYIDKSEKFLQKFIK